MILLGHWRDQTRTIKKISNDFCCFSMSVLQEGKKSVLYMYLLILPALFSGGNKCYILDIESQHPAALTMTSLEPHAIKQYMYVDALGCPGFF